MCTQRNLNDNDTFSVRSFVILVCRSTIYTSILTDFECLRLIAGVGGHSPVRAIHGNDFLSMACTEIVTPFQSLIFSRDFIPLLPISTVASAVYDAKIISKDDLVSQTWALLANFANIRNNEEKKSAPSHARIYFVCIQQWYARTEYVGVVWVILSTWVIRINQ